MTEEATPRIIRKSTPVREFDNLGAVAGVAVFPDRRRMATGSSDGMVRVWDLKNGVILKELEGRGEAMRGMALSRDGRLIAGSDCGGYVNAWDVDTGRALIPAFIAHDRDISSMDFAPDGTMLATASIDHTIKLWSTDTWQLQGQLINCQFYCHCVRYSPSGEHLAIATYQDIQIWDPSTRQCIANLAQGVQSLAIVWTADGTRLLSGDNVFIREWDTSTWKQVGPDIWRGNATAWYLDVNCNGTIVASPTVDNRVRLWRLSDRRTIAIFQHFDFPSYVTFSLDGKHILAGGTDKKISEWAVPEHAWPEDTPKDEAIHEAPHPDTEAQDSDTKASHPCTKTQDFATKTLDMSTAVRNACISGDLPSAEELLIQEIDANGNNYRAYANRSIVMARKLDLDHALDDATKSIGIQPSLMGYVSLGIALCGKKKARDANQAFDLASTFTDGNSKTHHFLYLVKAIALFNANQHADAMRRVRQLATAYPNSGTALACRIVEVYLHIQLGNNALDRACPTAAADHFTAAVNTGTFLPKSAIHSRYEEFVVLFGCDFTSLWQTANQKRCHALLRAGKLAEVFEAYQYMADMSDETTKASLDWSLSFMKELSTFQGHAPNADATPDMCKYDDENDSISDIDSNSDIS